MFFSLPLACLELGPAQSTRLSQPGFHFRLPALYSHVGGSCVRNCGPGFYGDPEMGDCEPCHQACETCTGLGHNQCSSCQEGLQLLRGTCVRHNQTQEEGSFWNGMCPPRGIAGVQLSPPPPPTPIPCFQDTQEMQARQ